MTIPTPAEIEAGAKVRQQAADAALRERDNPLEIEREFADLEERVARLGEPAPADAREAIMKDSTNG